MKSVKYQHEDIIPHKVACIARNYVEHIKELHNEVPSSMALFFKPNASITHELHTWDAAEEVSYEGEISLLVRDGNYKAVAFGIDLTKRKMQRELKSQGLPWEMCKAFKHAGVFSEFVDFENLEDLSLELWINDTLVQKGGVALMIYKPLEILAQLESFIDVEENDIVMTGTPKGVGMYKQGDVFVGKIFEGDKLLVEDTWVAQ